MGIKLCKKEKYMIITSDNMLEFLEKIEEITKDNYKITNFTTSSCVLDSQIINSYSALLEKYKKIDINIL